MAKTVVIYEVVDVDTGRKALIAVDDVVAAADYMTAMTGPRLRSYQRIGTLEIGDQTRSQHEELALAYEEGCAY